MLNRYFLMPLIVVSVDLVLPLRAHCNDAEVTDSFETRVVSIIDTVLDNHIDPPTRQEMVLDGARAVYEAANVDLPNDLSRHISDLSTNAEIAAYITGLLKSDLQGRTFFGRRGGDVEKPPELNDAFIDGMLRAVPGGLHLIEAEEARVQAQFAANRYVGVGIALGMKDDGPWIFKLIYHGPGRQAGVKQDDLILEIDGESTADKDLAQVVNELRGAEGSDVTLLLQNGDENPREVRVTRSVTFIPTVEGVRELTEGQWEYTVESAPDIAVLRVKQIGPSTLHEMKKIEAQLRRKQISGIVLDLRSGGGFLHDVVMLADQFLEQGTIGFAKSRDSLTKHEAQPGCIFRDVPIAIVINESSAAACVYLTAALQDQQRAVVVGEPTQGDAYVRSQIELPTGDRIVLATGYLVRGDGTVLQRRWRSLPDVQAIDGDATKTERKRKPSIVKPDYVVQSPSRSERHAAANDGRDPMLAKAIEVLGNAAAQARSEDKNDRIAG